MNITNKTLTILISFVCSFMCFSVCYSFQCDLSLNEKTLKKELQKEFGYSEILSINDLDENSREEFFKISSNNSCPGITWVNISGNSEVLLLLLKKKKKLLLIQASPLDAVDLSWIFKVVEKYKGKKPFLYKLKKGAVVTNEKGKEETIKNESLRVTYPGIYSHIYFKQSRYSLEQIAEKI